MIDFASEKPPPQDGTWKESAPALTAASCRDRRYLALFFPWLPAERLRSTQPHLSATRAEPPRAFVEKMRGAMRLSAVDEAAAGLGLALGLPMADARARVPDLELFDHAPNEDQDRLERLADGCIRYTPTVALYPPYGLILDTTDCDHLLGGERGLAADLERRAAAPPYPSVRSVPADRGCRRGGARRSASRFLWRRTLHDVARFEDPERIARSGGAGVAGTRARSTVIPCAL